MKSTTRYVLIGILIFVFLILSPLLILYVSGTKLDLESRDTSQTGILDAKSNPSDAKLLIDGKEHSKTPAIARFLAQGEYLFTLQKDGYFDWSKRLPIEPGQVTYAQVGVDQIQLIKKSEPIKIAGPNISSFLMINDKIWFTSGNTLSYMTLGNEAKVATEVSNPAIVKELRDKKHFIVRLANGSKLLVNSNTGQVYELPAVFNNAINIEMASDDTVLALSGKIVNAYNINTKKVTPLFNKCLGFTTLGNTGYFIKENGNISSAIWNSGNYVNEELITEGSAAAKENSELIITDRKELFLFDGSNLYRVGSKLDLLSSNVIEVDLDLNTNELDYKTAAELGFYNFLTSKPQLLTRNTSPNHTYFIRSSLGYGFVATDTGLELIEIDSRDSQNRYSLLPNKPVLQAYLTENQKTVIALQDGQLWSVEIRN